MLAPDHAPGTAFPATERLLRSALAGARLGGASFERPLSPCALSAREGLAAELAFLGELLGRDLREELDGRHGDPAAPSIEKELR